MTTKLILTHDVSHLGSAGEVVEVKDGYARNYLLPRKLATPWTKGAQRQIDQMAEAVKAAGGPAVDRRKIQVVPPIKSTGRHSASVRLHADVVAPLEVNVVPAR